MQLIPAIDIKGGKCVRLRQGRMDDETVFAENPVEMAQKWIDQGATRMHLVDLDGALAGKPLTLNMVKEIVEICGDVPVQIGGGIRNEETVVAYLEVGVQYLIIGSQAVKDPHFVKNLAPAYSGHIIVGLDAKDGKVATDGWSKLSKHDVVDMAQRFESDGVESIIYTDISRDGMMGGFNVESTKNLAASIEIPVIASGGFATLDDVKNLYSIETSGVSGAIIGRALYEGAFTLQEAIALGNELAQ